MLRIKLPVSDMDNAPVKEDEPILVWHTNSIQAYLVTDRSKKLPGKPFGWSPLPRLSEAEAASFRKTAAIENAVKLLMAESHLQRGTKFQFKLDPTFAHLREEIELELRAEIKRFRCEPITIEWIVETEEKNEGGK